MQRETGSGGRLELYRLAFFKFWPIVLVKKGVTKNYDAASCVMRIAVAGDLSFSAVIRHRSGDEHAAT